MKVSKPELEEGNLLSKLVVSESLIMLLLVLWALSSIRGQPLIIELPILENFIAYCVLGICGIYGFSLCKSGFLWLKERLRKEESV